MSVIIVGVAVVAWHEYLESWNLFGGANVHGPIPTSLHRTRETNVTEQAIVNDMEGKKIRVNRADTKVLGI